MSWIREVDVRTDFVPASGASSSGVNLPNVIKVMSINPKAIDAVHQMNRGITFGASALTRVQEEAIATTVSVANSCRY